MVQNYEDIKMTTNSSLQRRAKFYAKIIGLLFARQKLSGGTLAQVSRGARHLSLGIRLANPVELDKALKLSEAVALSANSQAVLAQRQAGLVVYQFQLAPAFWQSYTRSDLPYSQAVGLAERRQPVKFGFEQPHALIAGSTESGKSETAKSILLSLMTTYAPDELRVILIDLHGDYLDFANEVHLTLPIASTQEEIETALMFAHNALVHRKTNNIKDDYILFLAIDEADKALCTDERIEIAKALTQEGRKFRIHVLIGTHKPSHKDLPNILDNLNNRFVGLVSDAKVSANLTGHAGLQAHKLTGKGDFIHVQGINIQRFQVAMATRQDFESLERTEIKPVEVDSMDLLELPSQLPERSPGRPQLELNPEWLAYYFYHNPHKISRSMAKELGLTRPFHELHRSFCKDFIKAFLKLREKNGNVIGA
jgi:hypothetical protein